MKAYTKEKKSAIQFYDDRKNFDIQKLDFLAMNINDQTLAFFFFFF